MRFLQDLIFESLRTLTFVTMMGLGLIGLLPMAGCDQAGDRDAVIDVDPDTEKEKVIDIEAPGVDVEVDRDVDPDTGEIKDRDVDVNVNP